MRITITVVAIIFIILSLNICLSIENVEITLRSECDAVSLCNATVYSVADRHRNQSRYYYFSQWKSNSTTAIVNCSLPSGKNTTCEPPVKGSEEIVSIQDQAYTCLVDSTGWHERLLDLFMHFPHAAEAIFPCWNYFVECTDSSAVDEVERNLLILTNFSHPSAILFAHDEWTRSFLKVGNMAVKDLNDYLFSLKNSGKTQFELVEELNRSSYLKPSRYLKRSADKANNWHIGPTAARAFREINSLSLGMLQQVEEKNQSVLHIGILNRKGERELDNGGALKDALIDAKNLLLEVVLNKNNLSLSHHSSRQQSYQSIIIDHTTMDNKKFPEQVTWAAQQDIIITPHGAQNTNLAFIRPCTAVLEVYPHAYFIPEYFMSLVSFVGGIGFSSIELPHVSASPFRATVEHSDRVKARSDHVEVDVDIIVEHVMLTILEAHLACLDSLRVEE